MALSKPGGTPCRQLHACALNQGGPWRSRRATLTMLNKYHESMLGNGSFEDWCSPNPIESVEVYAAGELQYQWTPRNFDPFLWKSELKSPFGYAPWSILTIQLLWSLNFPIRFSRTCLSSHYLRLGWPPIILYWQLNLLLSTVQVFLIAYIKLYFCYCWLSVAKSLLL